MIVIILLAVSSTFPLTAYSNPQNTIYFIRDLMLHQEKYVTPAPVEAFLCWESFFIVKLLKILSNSGFLAMVQNSNWSFKSFNKEETVQYLVDISCNEYSSLLKQADDLKLFGFPQRWILLSRGWKREIKEDNSTSDEYNDIGIVDTEFIRNLSSINIDSNIVIGIQTEDDSFLLMEAYKRSFSSELVLNMTGSWSLEYGVKDNFIYNVLSARRSNLKKTLLKASMVVTDNDTLNHLTDYKNKHIDTITKLNYILLNIAMDMFNASLEIMVVNTWGYAKNGSWSGMVGQLQRREADIGATALFFTADRLPVIEYISMTSQTRATFVFRKPPLSYVANVFTLPFDRATWACSLVLLFVCGALLYITFKWENSPKDSLNDPSVDEYIETVEDIKMTWSDVLLLVISVVTEQGFVKESRGIPGRIVSMFLFIAILFLYTSYSACIVALLQSSTDSIITLEDLLNSRLEVGVHDIVYNRYYFETSTERIRKAIYKKKVAPPGQRPKFMTLEEGVSRIRKGFFAFHMEESNGYKLISETFLEDEKCGLQGVPGYIQVGNPWLAIQKHSPYREILKVGYRKITERGVQKREYSRLYTKKPECVNKGSSFTSVGIVDCYPAALILVYGVFCSVGMLILEVLASKRKKYRKISFTVNTGKSEYQM